MSTVPPSGPEVPGAQGCPLCGHVAPDRRAMLDHYWTRHMVVKDDAPPWRHWHVTGHDFGYKLREAKLVVAADRSGWLQARSEPLPYEPVISRCDVAHNT